MDQVKLDAILNNSIATIINSAGIITFSSDSFCTLSGYKHEELIGQNISIIYTDRHDPLLEDFMWNTIRRGLTWKGEVKHKNKQGEFFWVDLSLIPITDSTTGEAQYIAIYNDISQQKELIKTLKQRSQRQGIISVLGQLANNINQSQLFIEQAIATLTGALDMDMGVVLKNDDSHIAHFIASTEPKLLQHEKQIDLSQNNTLWGYTYNIKNELSFNDISNESNFTLPECLSTFTYQSGISIVFGENKSPYGLISLFKHSTENITYDDIFFAKMVGNLIYDVITRLDIKHALIKEKELTSKYLNTAEVMILVLDNNCNITLANQKTSQVLGLSQQQLIGQNWVEKFIPESRKRDEKHYYQKLLKDGIKEEKTSSESIIYDSHGQRRQIKWNHTLLTDDNNHISGIINAGEDITELLNAEKKQRHLQKELYQAQKMEAIGMITGGITHDFNNILASILGFSNLALERFAHDKDSKLAIYLNEIDKAGRKARDIITQIQNFSHNDKSDIKPENIASLVNSILIMLRSAIPSSMEFEQCIDDNLPPAIIRPDKFNQVIMHLLINARNATHNRGKIKLSVTEQNNFSAQCSSCKEYFSGHYIEINITDNGDGLTEEQINNIFSNSENNTTGLAIVHRIIHESNAHMLIESAIGMGTQLRLFFEVASHHNEYQTQQSTALVKPEPNTHFMIVDDENSVASFLGEFINTIGCLSTVFTDPTLALKAMQNSPHDYDILITDQTMPSLCGDELIQEIRKLNASIPVILCTGNNDHINAELVHKLDIQALLHKPFEKEDLLNSISQLLQT